MPYPHVPIDFLIVADPHWICAVSREMKHRFRDSRAQPQSPALSRAGRCARHATSRGQHATAASAAASSHEKANASIDLGKGASMVARQQHGLFFEEYLDRMMDHYESSSGYTDEHDAEYKTSNGLRYVSVKNTSMRGEICLGDFYRIVNCTDHMLMFDGRHDSNVPMPDRVIVYDLPDGFASVFPSSTSIDEVVDLVEEFRDYMMCDDNLDLEALRDDTGNPDLTFSDHEFDPYWRKRRLEYLRAYRELFESKGGILIHPRPKRDHSGKNRRLQCAIPRRYLRDFFERYAVIEVIWENTGDITVRDYTGYFASFYDMDAFQEEVGPDFEDVLPFDYVANYGSGEQLEYQFTLCGDEDQEDLELRMWDWVGYLIYEAL